MKQSVLEDLKKRTQLVIDELEAFREENDEALSWKAAPDRWSALECIEHLRYYSDFYIPEIDKRLRNGRGYQEENSFRSGWLGNYFAEMMKPEGKKMSTLKKTDPSHHHVDRQALPAFRKQQDEMHTLLQRADDADLTRTRAGISIAPWLTLRLGDILRVVVYHNERHILQARRSLEQFHKHIRTE